MNVTRALGISLLACGLGAVGCAGTSDDASATSRSGSAAESRGEGFGSDLIFDNLIAPSSLIARADCGDFGIKAGDRLSVVADEDYFGIERDADRTAIVAIRVPSDGDYVWTGTRPSRTTTKIVSRSLGLEASMDSVSTAIRLSQWNHATDACVLDRCPAYGACN